MQVQLFEEVPELAARAISHLLQAHPGVVERLVRVGGVLHLCQYVVTNLTFLVATKSLLPQVPAEPTSHLQRGTAEAAIKVPPEAVTIVLNISHRSQVLKLVSEHQPHAVIDAGGLRPMITFIATAATHFPVRMDLKQTIDNVEHCFLLQADVTSAVLSIVDSLCRIISKEELRMQVQNSSWA